MTAASPSLKGRAGVGSITTMKKTYILYILYLFPIGMFLSGCSSTKSIPEGDQLFTGVKSINYTAEKKDAHFTSTKEEVDAPLPRHPTATSLAPACALRSPSAYGYGTSSRARPMASPNGCLRASARTPCSCHGSTLLSAPR